ncbi:MAG: hypothetical protein ACTSPB_20465 [Candidatus Thorarchaeota archaeon]
MKKKTWIAISIVLLLSNIGLATALILQTLTIPATVKLEPQIYIELQHLNGTKIETLNFGTVNQLQTVTFDCRIVNLSTETIQISWNQTLNNSNLTLELYYNFGGNWKQWNPNNQTVQLSETANMLELQFRLIANEDIQSETCDFIVNFYATK